MRLSIVVPAYNEEATIDTALKRLLAVRLPCESEIVVVDDGSTDRTGELAASLEDPRVHVIHRPTNKGKGAAVATGAQAASGDYMLIQDADLEYDPRDIPRLVEPILAGDAETVFGVRGFGSHNSYSFLYVMGNKLVTLAMNLSFNVYLSDVETCYKLFPIELYRSLDLKSTGFGVEAELTAKLLSRGQRIYEVPISYRARGRQEGKKLKASDGLEALAVILAVRFGGEPLVRKPNRIPH